MSFRLMKLIVSMIDESVAREEEAIAALRASEAMIKEIGLQKKANVVIQT